MCLCGLSDCDRRVAHGELVGVQMLMEDVLLGSCHVIRKASTEWQAALDNAQVFLAREYTWCMLCLCKPIPESNPGLDYNIFNTAIVSVSTP